MLTYGITILDAVDGGYDAALQHSLVNRLDGRVRQHSAQQGCVLLGSLVENVVTDGTVDVGGRGDLETD